MEIGPLEVDDVTTTTRQNHALTTIAGVLGNALEWYDFALFGFFSDIIADVFFPPLEDDDSNTNIVRAFAIFGSAFIMRPVGGIMVGYIGDKYGRKTALTGSQMLMALPTFAMGLLPSYASIGWLAPVLLLCCRLVQGISVGGQLPASLVYTAERQPREKWGLYASLPMMAANGGAIFGNFVGAVLRSALSDQQLHDYGWRIPFVSGILIAFVAIYLRLHGEDVHPNEGVFDQENSEHKNPIRVACMSKNRLALVASAFVCIIWSGGGYITFTWMAIYMNSLLDPPLENAFWINLMASLLGGMVFLPIFGALSDLSGVSRLKCMGAATIGISIWGPLTIYFIGLTGNDYVAFGCQWFLGVLFALFGSSLCAWLIETFDPEIRLSSVSLGYDIAHASAGGFSPAIATLLFDDVGIYSPGILYPIYGAVALLGMYLMHRHKREYGIDKKNVDPNDTTDVKIREVL